MAESYGVIGLGKFGFHIATELLKQGKKVIIADKNEAAVREIADLSNSVFILDSSDILALKEAGFSNLDFVIISIGENIESSILTLMALKEIGVKNIIAKAITPTHGRILSKLGASKVIYPEREAAQHLLANFITNPEIETMHISNSLKIAKIKITRSLVGKSPKDIAQSLQNNKEDNIKIIAFKRSNQMEWSFDTAKETPLFENDRIILLGQSNQIDNFKY